MLVMGSAIAANAQVRDNVVKLNIFSPIVKTFNIAYERTLNADNSIQLGVAITGTEIGDTKFSGVQITPEYRFYLSESEAPDGFYAAPFIRYSNLTLKDDVSDSEAELSGFGGGLILGRHWLLGDSDRVSLDVFLGPSYSSGSVEVKSGTDTFDTGAFDGFGIRFGVTFGIAF